MQVFKVSDGSGFADYSVDETKKELSIGGVVINLEDEVQDCQTLITITRAADGRFIRGLEGKAGYVVDIEIPPREYVIEESEVPEETGESNSGESGGGNTMGNTVTTRRALPLDIKKVVLRLWPFGAGEIIQQEG
jgi:hypothetical protein